MSALSSAQNVLVQGTVAAIGGNQNNYVQADAPAVSGELHFAGGQNNYMSVPLKGIDLLHRHIAPAALLDSGARLDQPRCMPGTREAIIQEIMEWIKGGTDKSASILWIEGPVGTGKTAVEHTIAELCQRHGLLIASFFFSRTASNSSNGNFLIPTLAYQIISTFPGTRRYINKVVLKDPHLFEKARETQMKKLIIEPLKHLPILRRIQNKLGLKPYPRLIAIDGLDECSDKAVLCDILRIIGEALRDLDLPIRFLIASRPEPHIVQEIGNIRSRNPTKPITQIDLKEDALSRRDIDLYLRAHFQDVVKLHSELPADWPGEPIITQLVDKSSGQFIFAVTVMSYINSAYDSPEDRLQVVLLMSAPPSDDRPFAQIDCLYLHILRTAKRRQSILQILAILIAERAMGVEDGAESLGPADIEVLLDWRRGDVRRSLTDMHSLIDIRENEGYIKILHASLSDFLLDASRSMELFIDHNASHWRTILQARSLLKSNFKDLVPSRENQKVVSDDTLDTLIFRQTTMDFSREQRVAVCIGVMGTYKSFVRSAPWLRIPATDVLHRVCKMVMSDYNTTESNIYAHLQPFWNNCEWSTIEINPGIGPPNEVFLMVKFIGMLSNGNLSQKAGDIGHHTQMVVFKCRRSEGSKIYFDLAIDDWPVTALNIRYHRCSQPQALNIMKLRSGSSEDQHIEAWRAIANAYLQAD